MIFFGVTSVILVLLAFLFNYLEFEGWGVFFIVLTVISGLVLLIFSTTYFMENKEDTGDIILVHLYFSDLLQKGYDTYSTRSGYKNKRYYPLAFNKMGE